jgi:GNAT superfamily N-acetyltransferase
VTSVRRAVPADRDAVLATIVAAFHDDPAWDFLTAGDRGRVAPLFAGAVFDSRVDRGSVWTTDDCRAVALWEWRDADTVPHDGDAIWAAYREAAGEDAWHRLEVYEKALDSMRPAPPYWYLGVLATHPDAQGRGLATAVVAPVLEIADHDHIDCWLETSKTTNLGFYERRGFCQRLPVEVPDGPPTWWCRRAPAQRRAL